MFSIKRHKTKSTRRRWSHDSYTHLMSLATDSWHITKHELGWGGQHGNYGVLKHHTKNTTTLRHNKYDVWHVINKRRRYVITTTTFETSLKTTTALRQTVFKSTTLRQTVLKVWRYVITNTTWHTPSTNAPVWGSGMLREQYKSPPRLSAPRQGSGGSAKVGNCCGS